MRGSCDAHGRVAVFQVPNCLKNNRKTKFICFVFYAKEGKANRQDCRIADGARVYGWTILVQHMERCCLENAGAFYCHALIIQGCNNQSIFKILPPRMR